MIITDDIYKIEPTDFPLKALSKHFMEEIPSKGLELGANEESCCAILQHAGYEMTGIDKNTYRWNVADPYPEFQLDDLSWKQILAPFDQAEDLLSTPYDFVISLSAIEHFGLGFYGDDLNPQADSDAMRLVRSWLKPGGSFYLTVPVGQSRQTHHWRRYSESELFSRLLSGWNIEMQRFYKWDLQEGIEEASAAQAYACNDIGCIYETLLILS